MIVEIFRALFRIISLMTLTFSIYAVWIVGAPIFSADRILWRRRIFTKWSKAVARILRMNIEVTGQLPGSPFILVSNHLSYLDIPAFHSVVPVVFIAKSEVGKWFLVGKIIRRMETVFINRNKRRDIGRAGQEIIRKIKNGENLMFFPEATSTNGESVLPFKSSFFEFAVLTELPVYYASITYRIPDSSENPGDVICWWGDSEFTGHLWQLCRIKTFNAAITFGQEPVRDSNRKNLARRLHAAVSENFVPVK